MRNNITGITSIYITKFYRFPPVRLNFKEAAVVKFITELMLL